MLGVQVIHFLVHLLKRRDQPRRNLVLCAIIGVVVKRHDARRRLGFPFARAAGDVALPARQLLAVHHHRDGARKIAGTSHSGLRQEGHVRRIRNDDMTARFPHGLEKVRPLLCRNQVHRQAVPLLKHPQVRDFVEQPLVFEDRRRLARTPRFAALLVVRRLDHHVVADARVQNLFVVADHIMPAVDRPAHRQLEHRLRVVVQRLAAERRRIGLGIVVIPARVVLSQILQRQRI